MSAIRCERLRKRFGDLHAVDGLTFEVAEGELFGLVGPDGAGKTTTMRLLCGLMTPDEGDAWVAGYHVVQDAFSLRDQVGYLSQRFGLYADLTVLENIRFFADLRGEPRTAQEEKIARLLELTDLKPFGNRLAGALSGGMKQKLSLICALIHTPQILFLDEPTTGVDPLTRREFWRIIRRLQAEGTTIFLATAYLEEAEYCNRLALIHGGRLLAIGTPAEIKGLPPGRIWEIDLVEARKALHVLQQRLPAATVSLFGNRLHLYVSAPDFSSEEVHLAMEEAGLQRYEIRPVPFSLEDVLVYLLAEAKKAKEPSI